MNLKSCCWLARKVAFISRVWDSVTYAVRHWARAVCLRFSMWSVSWLLRVSVYVCHTLRHEKTRRAVNDGLDHWLSIYKSSPCSNSYIVIRYPSITWIKYKLMCHKVHFLLFILFISEFFFGRFMCVKEIRKFDLKFKQTQS